MFIYYLISIIIIAVDQLTKYLTVENIALHERVTVIPGVLSFTYHQNTGAAWSILEGQMLFFYIVTVIAVGVIIYYMQTAAKGDPLFALSLSFFLGGAIGNFIDRLFLQYVIDMIRLDFINFPIFNIADMALSVGVGLMLVYLLVDEWKNYQKKKAGHTHE